MCAGCVSVLKAATFFIMTPPSFLTAVFPRAIAWVMAWIIAFICTACAIHPSYQPPNAPDVSAYKEAGDWVAATPLDTLERGPWWQLFNDPVLNDLAERVEVSNQNIAAATAAYAQARALVAEQRAALFPSVTLNSSARRAGNGGGATSVGSRGTPDFQASLGATWELDVWGRLQNTGTSLAAAAAASAADLAAATLAAQGELVINYLSLRQQDTQKALLASSLRGYARALEITQNRYAAGLATQTDVLQAQTQLAHAGADEAGVQRTRAQLEHAIAVLVGLVPSQFTLAALPQWQPTVPDIPLGVPSTLLQRRPDVAAAERRMASANAQIGVAKAAYYPSLSLNASGGTTASRVAELFSAPAALWSFGGAAAQVLFKGDAPQARVDGARATHDQTVARYRQVVLNAFQSVEDQLSAHHVLRVQQGLRAQATSAADQVEQRVLNRYRSGQIGYAEVIAAQTTALSARRAFVQSTADRQTSAVALIQSLGGGWQALP